jgi:hypothetical protein
LLIVLLLQERLVSHKEVWNSFVNCAIGFSIHGLQSEVAKFYAKKDDAAAVSFVADFKLLQKVWQWLTARRDCLIGLRGEYQRLSLPAVQAMEPQPKLYSTEDRMWIAITGHSKDLKRVPPLLFDILCIITSRGSDGITQPELVELTGQDKRSVPKRTDMLAKNGLIEKKPIYIKKARTSLLIHKKFCPKLSDSVNNAVFKYGHIQMDVLMSVLVENVKQAGTITESDLMITLKLPMSQKRVRKLVRQSIDRLVIIGLFDCFNAPSQIQALTGRIRRVNCLKLLREPAEGDIKAATNITVATLVKHREQRQIEKRTLAGDATQADEEEEDDPMEEIDLTISTNIIGEDEDMAQEVPDDDVIEYCTFWDSSFEPFDVVNEFIRHAGPKGVTSAQVRNRLYGPYFTRVTDQLLRNLSDCWTTSQPPHLRKFTIIRDTETSNKITFYVYRSFYAFQEAVNIGVTSWDEIGGGNLQDMRPPQLDKWGFPTVPAGKFQDATKVANLRECVVGMKDRKINIEMRDPRVYWSNGTPVFTWNNPELVQNPIQVTIDAVKLLLKEQDFAKNVKKGGWGTGSYPKTLSGQASVIKGIPHKEYHRLYQAKQKLQKEQKARMPQLRRYAIWKASQEISQSSISPTEAVEIQNPANGKTTVQDLQPSTNKLLHSSSKHNKRKRDSDVHELSLDARKRTKYGQSAVTALRDNVVSLMKDGVLVESQESGVENPGLLNIGQPLLAAQNNHKAVPSEFRIKEIIEEIRDCRNQGVHIKPPGGSDSQPADKMPREHRAPCIVLFKFDWLRTLDWFVREATPPLITGSEDTMEVDSHLSVHDDYQTNEHLDTSLAIVGDDVLLSPHETPQHVSNQSKKPDSTDSTTVITDRPNSDRRTGVYRIKKRGRQRADRPDSLCLKFVLPGAFIPKDHTQQIAADTAERLNEGLQMDNVASPSTPISVPTALAPATANSITLWTEGSRQVGVYPYKKRGRPTNKISLYLKFVLPRPFIPGSSSYDQQFVATGDSPYPTRAETPSLIPENDQVEAQIFDEITSSSARNNASVDTIMKNSSSLTPVVPRPSTPVAQLSAVLRTPIPIPSTNRSRIASIREGAVLGSGGSRFRRGRIILDIVEKCHGVFPGDWEIIVPFNAVNKAAGETLADRATVAKAVKNLVNQRKLIKYHYLIETKQGQSLTRNVLAKPDIRFDDRRVQDIIQKCTAMYPKNYIPPEVDIRDMDSAKSAPPSANRYFRPNDSVIVVPQTSNQQPDVDQELAPWEKLFYQRQRQLAQERQKRYESGDSSQSISMPQIIMTKTIERKGDGPLRVQLRPGSTILDDKYVTRSERDVPGYGSSIQIVPGKYEQRHLKREMKALAQKDKAEQGAKITPVPIPRPHNTPVPIPRSQHTSVPIAKSQKSPASKPKSKNRPVAIPRSKITPVPIPRSAHQPSSIFETQITSFVPNPPGKRSRSAKWQTVAFKHGQERHKARLLGPHQSFNRLNGTFSTDFRLQSNNGSTSTAQVAEWYDEVPGAVQEEVEDWNTAGYIFKLVDDGSSTGFVTYGLGGEDYHTFNSAYFSRAPIQPKLSIRKQKRGVKNSEKHYSVSDWLQTIKYPAPALETSVPSEGFIVMPPATPLQQIIGTRTWVKLNPDCIITPRMSRKLLHTIIVCRTLAGGVSQNVPWAIVDSVLSRDEVPHYSLQNFQRRWEWMSRKYPDAVGRLQETFEVNFLEAYQAGNLPSFQVNNMYNYDWDFVIEWTLGTIDVTDDLIKLPANKSMIDKTYNVDLMSVDYPKTHKPLYRAVLTTHRKANLIEGMDLCAPLFDEPYVSATLPDIMLARSWAKAAILNSNQKAGDTFANAKLRLLDKDVLEKVVESLAEESIIVPGGPKRNSSLTGFYTMGEKTDFAKRIGHFKEGDFEAAMSLKKHIDSIFRTGSNYSLPITTKNGEMLALDELLSQNRVELNPNLPEITHIVGAPTPRISAWGMTEGSYVTKLADRSHYTWEMVFTATPSYVYGFPLQKNLKKTPIPLVHSADEAGFERIPHWVNIHGELMRHRWKFMLLHVLGICVMEVGVNAETIVHTLEGAVEVWEVEMMLNWLIRVEAIDMTEEGLRAKEWWWTVISDGK